MLEREEKKLDRLDLNTLQDCLLEFPLYLVTLVVGCGFAVQVQKSTEIELGGLEELDLADVNVLKRIDALGRLLNLPSNNLRDELGCELGQSAAGGFTLDDFGHLLADSADLGRSSICSLLDLVGASLSESNGEKTEEVIVGGLDGHVGLDQGLPLAHERAKLVGCKVQTVEVGEAVLALDFVDTELDLAESVVFVVLKISERDLKDTALQGVVGILQTGGSVDKGFSNISDLECGRSLDGIFIFAREGIHGPLLQALLALRQPLVPKRKRQISI
jgi:hypothetical protein